MSAAKAKSARPAAKTAKTSAPAAKPAAKAAKPMSDEAMLKRLREHARLKDGKKRKFNGY